MILLFSGGIDSYVAWHYLGKPDTVYFDVRSRYSAVEMETVKKLIPETVFDTSLDLAEREKENANIPYRNLLFALQATHYSPTVVIAGIKDDDVLDKSESAFQVMTHTMRVIDGVCATVFSPFWHLTKRQIVEWFLENAGTETDLLNTISCYSGEHYCGRCASCFRKWCALLLNGIDIDYHNRELALDYLSKAKAGHYVNERNNDIREAVRVYYGKR